MDSEHEPHSGRVPLPGFDGSGPADQAGRPAAAPRDGIRRARRMSNWTAAALIVGTGAATVALAHQAFPVAAPATSSSQAAPGTGTVTTTPGAPSASHSVVTTSGSGVTTTTTTRMVNGKTVITHVRHAPAYQDN
jgi:hypothetical protein